MIVSLSAVETSFRGKVTSKLPRRDAFGALNMTYSFFTTCKDSGIRNALIDDFQLPYRR